MTRRGCWGYAQLEHVVDAMDFIQVPEPDDKQQVSATNKSLVKGAQSTERTSYTSQTMNVEDVWERERASRYGDDRAVLDPGGEAKMYYNYGRWSTEFKEGVPMWTVDLKPQVGREAKDFIRARRPPHPVIRLACPLLLPLLSKRVRS